MVEREKLRLAGWMLAAIVAVVLGVRLIGSGDERPPPVKVDRSAASSAGLAPAAAQGGPDLLVQVAGQVKRPGVYRLPSGTRVNDAVARAGGLTRRADPAGVNLVARVQDGQQVVVPRRGAAGASAAVAGSNGAPGGPSAGPVSLSSATVAQLDTLDGIGPTLAQRIVDYRQAHGGFSSVDQLRQVEGIGDKRFTSLKKGVVP
jgi:competence protein ComEA